jgi:hypothetical protein
VSDADTIREALAESSSSIFALDALDSLVADRERLTTALTEIAEWEGFTADCCDCMEDVVGIARAVLAGEAAPPSGKTDSGRTA